jgi:hypothetical protein
MRNSQRGVTFLGWLFLLLPLAIVLYVGIRLTPVYLNYMAVARSLEQVANESAGEEQPNPAAVRVSLEKHFDIEGINHPTIKEIEIRREGEGWVAIADYEDLAPLFANVSILVQFHKQVDL